MSRHCRKRLLGLLLAAVALVVSVTMQVVGAAPVAASSPSGSAVTWRSIDPPENGDVAGAQWIEIDVPVPSMSDRWILAAIFHPEGEGPFPVVVYLHGGSGLATGMLRWAPHLSEAGGPASDRGVAALLDVASQLPDARQDGLGILGLSIGARMAFSIIGDPHIRAVVTDSGDPSIVPLVEPSSVGAAVLLLSFEQEGFVDELALRQYEQRLRDLGKPVELRFFDGTGHVTTLSQGTGVEATALTIDFFSRHLRQTSQAPLSFAMPIDLPTR